MLQPAGDMPAGRIVVCPVYDTALGVPFVFAEELNRVTFTQAVNPRRQVDVVADQQGLAGAESQYESLVPGAVEIVSQGLDDNALAPDLNPALTVGKRLLDEAAFGGWR